MPGEKQNRIKQKLEQLSAVPNGFRFNEEHTWQAMEPKLRPKRKRFLWVPTAAILLVFFTGYFFIGKHQSKLQPAASIVQTISKPVTKNASLPAPVPSQKTTALFKPQTVSNKRMIMLPVVIAQGLSSKQPALLPPSETPIQSALLSPADTVLTTALPLKPRFKIAHVNELNVLPVIVPEESKKTLALSIRRLSLLDSDEALPADDNPVIQRKRRTLFSPSLNTPQ